MSGWPAATSRHPRRFNRKAPKVRPRGLFLTGRLAVDTSVLVSIAFQPEETSIRRYVPLALLMAGCPKAQPESPHAQTPQEPNPTTQSTIPTRLEAPEQVTELQVEQREEGKIKLTWNPHQRGHTQRIS